MMQIDPLGRDPVDRDPRPGPDPYRTPTGLAVQEVLEASRRMLFTSSLLATIYFLSQNLTGSMRR